MQAKPIYKHFIVTVALTAGGTRDVVVRASDRQTAERRALKRTNGVGVYACEEIISNEIH